MNDARRGAAARLIAATPTRAALTLAATLLVAAAALADSPTPALAAAAPQVGASWSTGVSSGAANLNAEVNPEGLPTTYRFEYLTEAQYQANLAAPLEGFADATKAPAGAEANLGAASTVQPALQHIGPLSPATTYRYRIIATNSDAPSGASPAPNTPSPPKKPLAPSPSPITAAGRWSRRSKKTAGRSRVPARTSAATSCRPPPRAAPSPTARPPPSVKPPRAPRPPASTSRAAGKAKRVGQPRTSLPPRSRAPMAQNPTASPISSSPPTSPAACS